MKILSLNIWDGNLLPELISFLKKYKDIVDIFLFQEVSRDGTEKAIWSDGEEGDAYRLIQQALPGYQGLHAPSLEGEWGLATFIKEGVYVASYKEIFVHKGPFSVEGRDASTMGRNIQCIDLGGFVLINFHGLWLPNGKKDTQSRLDQSNNIIKEFRTFEKPGIIMGDFNYHPDNKSLKLFDEAGFNNLIQIYGIKSTRSSHYTKECRFADYALCSSEIKVIQFEVLPDEVSDHLALYLEV